jgi:hypothetical protein
MRCDEGAAWVPSRVIECDGCGADCWLSEYSGEDTLAAARAMEGRLVVWCRRCLETSLLD